MVSLVERGRPGTGPLRGNRPQGPIHSTYHVGSPLRGEMVSLVERGRPGTGPLRGNRPQEPNLRKHVRFTGAILSWQKIDGHPEHVIRLP